MDFDKTQPLLRAIPRPNESNSSCGDVFGGWLMSQMDLAGFVAAKDHVKGRIATVAVNNIEFLAPVYVFDLVSVYAEDIKMGKSSITVKLVAYAKRVMEHVEQELVKVGTGEIVYVAIKEPGEKREL